MKRGPGARCTCLRTGGGGHLEELLAPEERADSLRLGPGAP